MAVLGISTNTRLLGLAIINTEGLKDYSIRLFKSPWSPHKANLMITSLEPCVRQYSIKAVVLSMPPAHCHTRAYLALCDAVKEYFAKKHIPVACVPASSLHSLCKDGGRKTKRKVMNAVSDIYPELRICYTKELRNKNKYYVKVFEAVGVATLHHRRK